MLHVMMRITALLAACVAVGATTWNIAPVTHAVATPGPILRMIDAQNSVTISEYKNHPVSVDPGIWLASIGSDFRLDVRRAGLTGQMRITQIIKAGDDHIERRQIPSALLDGWAGLKNFLRFTIRNLKGKLITSVDITFCPDSFNPQRVTTSSAPSSPYPQQCGTLDPFQLAGVWGIENGWAVDPVQTSSLPDFTLSPSTYHVTETLTGRYARLFHVPSASASATVTVRVIKTKICCGVINSDSSSSLPREPAQLGWLPSIRTVTRPSRSALPDLVAQPSWDISISHTHSGRDLLNFGATVWVRGNSPLDVEGFRVPGSPVMKAYQYFWLNGRVVGHVRVGTMGFAGYNHWHFRQLAAYRLLNAGKKLAVRSHKEGFCIAPTDIVEPLLPQAVWQPSAIGLGGQCGVSTALWVQEYMPIGWGDTYEQYVPGQAFDITDLPNGTYYIEVIANPFHELRELTVANDISFRKVILGGRLGKRTVCVPAWHGIDPEC